MFNIEITKQRNENFLNELQINQEKISDDAILNLYNAIITNNITLFKQLFRVNKNLSIILLDINNCLKDKEHISFINEQTCITCDYTTFYNLTNNIYKVSFIDFFALMVKLERLEMIKCSLRNIEKYYKGSTHYYINIKNPAYLHICIQSTKNFTETQKYLCKNLKNFFDYYDREMNGDYCTPFTTLIRYGSKDLINFVFNILPKNTDVYGKYNYLCLKPNSYIKECLLHNSVDELEIVFNYFLYKHEYRNERMGKDLAESVEFLLKNKKQDAKEKTKAILSLISNCNEIDNVIITYMDLANHVKNDKKVNKENLSLLKKEIKRLANI